MFLCTLPLFLLNPHPLHIYCHFTLVTFVYPRREIWINDYCSLKKAWGLCSCAGGNEEQITGFHGKFVEVKTLVNSKGVPMSNRGDIECESI